MSSHRTKNKDRLSKKLAGKTEKNKHIVDATDKDSRDTLVNANSTESKKQLSNKERLELYLKALSTADLAELPAEQILEMRKRLNPYGRTIAGSDNYLNFSITQISHEYWKKFITTAMIAYLNRMCDEWKVPNGVPVISVYDYLENKSLLDTPDLAIQRNNKSSIYDYEFNRKWMEKRIIVKEFLEEMFQFNPDEHVRSAYRPNYKDQSRKPLETMAARIAVNHVAKTDRAFKTEKILNDESKGIKVKKIRRTVVNKKTGEKIVKIIEVPADDQPVEKPVAHTVPLDPEHPKDPTAVSTATNMIPPHDMFGRFMMYYKENYEELRNAVEALYCEKPELELAINPYAWHKSPEEAEAFKKQHSDEVIAEVFTATSGKWNFFDSFKAQRDSVNFYNKNTIILEEMVKQIERDERLGQDLMAKRVEKEKKKNVIEAGPDAENFKKWREENVDLSKMGAKYYGDAADEDMPENSVQVDVWKIAKGGLEVAKDKFYSQAEAPTFVKEAQDKAAAGTLEMPAAPPQIESRADNV